MEENLDLSINMIFEFENEYRENLHFLPVGMRYKLDLSGLKLGLEAWQLLAPPTRFMLLNLPFKSTEEIEDFRRTLRELLAGTPEFGPKDIPSLEPRAWAKSLPFPKCIVDACKGLGIELEDEAWGRLSELQRYALWKLSQSQRKPETFKQALREFLPSVG